MPDQNPDPNRFALGAPDPIIIAYMLDALKYLCLGEPETAQRSLEHALSHYMRQYHPEGRDD